MLKDKHIKALRTLVILNLALMALLLAFGLAFSTEGLASASGASAGTVLDDLNRAGASSFIHMILGLFVGLFSLINLVLALRSGLPRVQFFGSLAFLAILFAGSLGLVYIFTGFRFTWLILFLVPLFVISVLSYLLELYSLRRPPQPLAG